MQRKFVLNCIFFIRLSTYNIIFIHINNRLTLLFTLFIIWFHALKLLDFYCFKKFNIPPLWLLVGRWQPELRVKLCVLHAILCALFSGAEIVLIAHAAPVGKGEAFVLWKVIGPSRKFSIAGSSVELGLIARQYCRAKINFISK